jgi:hypothetical protein
VMRMDNGDRFRKKLGREGSGLWGCQPGLINLCKK